MKRLLVLWASALASALPAAAQATYQALCDSALQAVDRDSLECAERLFRQAVELEPANMYNALLFSNLGTIQRRMQKHEEALESYTSALALAPRSVPILMNRATLYMEMGREDAACADYSSALDYDKDNQEALLMRAYIYMRKHDYRPAEADYRHLLQLDPSDFNGRLGLATLEQREGRPGNALAILDGILSDLKDAAASMETNERRATVYVARAGVEQDLGQLDLALADLDEAVRLHPSLAEAYLVRGQIYLAQEKKEPARRDFEQAILLGASRADLHDLLRACK